MNEEEQYRHEYGPFQPGKHTIGSLVRFHDGNEVLEREVIWSYTKEGQLAYVVYEPNGEYWPEVVLASELIEA